MTSEGEGSTYDLPMMEHAGQDRTGGWEVYRRDVTATDCGSGMDGGRMKDDERGVLSKDGERGTATTLNNNTW